MDHIGMDVHKKESQICILAEGGELIERRGVIREVLPAGRIVVQMVAEAEVIIQRVLPGLLV